MKAEAKVLLAEEFITRMKAQLLAAIATMPDEFDGHEVKEFIGEEFYSERTHLMRSDRRRMRAYRRWTFSR